MKRYYVRDKDSAEIRGPYSPQEIRVRIPSTIDPEVALVTPATGQSRFALSSEATSWVPVASILPPLISVGKIMPPVSRYRDLRTWTNFLGGACFLFIALAMVVDLLKFGEMERTRIVSLYSLVDGIIRLFVVFVVKHAILLFADLVETQQERTDQARRNPPDR